MSKPFLRCLLGSAIASLGLTVTLACIADPETSELAAAKALFEQGKARLDRDDWIGACAAFDESLALHVNVSTLIKVARCREHEGKLATAGQAYGRARALNHEEGGPRDEHQAALDAVIEHESSELAPRIPRLRIVVADAPEDLTVHSNGTLVSGPVLGEAFPVDPGTYEISVNAPGFVEVTKTAKVVERTAPDEVVEVFFRLTPVSRAPSTASPSEPVAVGQPAREQSLPPTIEPPAPNAEGAPIPMPAVPAERYSDRRGSNPLRSAGYVAGGIGLAGLGAAGVLGILTLERVDESKPYCNYPGGTCNDRGMELRDEARQLQTAAFVVAGLSGAAAITGVALVVRSKNTARTATLSLTPAALEGELRW